MHVLAITKRVLFRFSSSSTSPHFTLLSSSPAHDLKMQVNQYLHSPTNARIYHFLNSDPDNAFASIIRTYPQDNSGCPHILEHLACCGSQKYPIRDPFFNMLRRSVNTYMNAWTGDDFTSYLFSSANPTDWRNLYNVYLDMTFKANLHELDFRQEGWRYELEHGKKQLKGIVLNEMKGAYQDSDRQLISEINQQLFKGTPYAFDSGGKPKDIVNLDYSDLKKMYQYYYHPSNMAFFFYGSADIAPNLEFLHKEYLSGYSDQSQRYEKTLIPAPVSTRHKTVISSSAQTNNISINYLLNSGESLSPLDTICLRILAYLLLEKSNAKLYQRFIESGTAQNIGFSGFNQAKLSTFTLTLKGVFPQYSCKEFQQEFRAVIQEIAEKGLQKDRLQEFSHQFEVNLLTPRETNGIKILGEIVPLMNHRLNLDLFLRPRHYLAEAVSKLQQKDFLHSLLDRFFLKNERVVVVRQIMADTELPEQHIESQVKMEDSVIREQQEQLQQRQNQKANTDVLPMLRMEDITQAKRREPNLVRIQTKGEKQLMQYHVPIEEDINFYRLAFNFEAVDTTFLQRMALWTHTINRVISTKNFNYNQLTSELANCTAGFNVFHTAGEKDDLNIIFEFSCLKKNVKRAFGLLEEILFSPKFEKEHTLNAFKAYNNEATEGLIDNPMNECIGEAAAQLTRKAAILNNYQRIKDSLTLIKDESIEDFYQFSLQLTQCSNVKLIQHSNHKPIDLTSIHLARAFLSSSSSKISQFEFIPKLAPKAVVYTYMVNFCAQQYKAPPHLSKQHAHINLLLEILGQDYLHPIIRQKGGAYGSAARVRNNGTISLSSYLDPNTLTTFKAFDTSIQDLLSKDKIEDLSLLQAKIRQFGEVDRVKIPQDQGVNQILKGYTREQFETFREMLKTATFKEIVDTGRIYLSGPKSKCLFGKVCPEGFEQEKLKDFLL